MSNKFFHDWRYFLAFLILSILCGGFTYSWDHTVKVKKIVADRTQHQVMAQSSDPPARPAKVKKKKHPVQLPYWRGKFPYCTNGKVHSVVGYRLSDQLIVTCADGTVWFDSREHFQ